MEEVLGQELALVTKVVLVMALELVSVQGQQHWHGWGRRF